ncbi:MAG: NYN domain-containing protein [Nocardioidaceae bacterium]
MRLAHPPAEGPRTVEVVNTEEKGSDVNLASLLLLDPFRRECDLAVVVSNDSDLCEPIRVAKEELGIRVGILNPAQHPSQDLVRLRPAFVKRIRPGALAKSQLPEALIDPHGDIVRRPSRW